MTNDKLKAAGITVTRPLDYAYRVVILQDADTLEGLAESLHELADTIEQGICTGNASPWHVMELIEPDLLQELEDLEDLDLDDPPEGGGSIRA